MWGPVSIENERHANNAISTSEADLDTLIAARHGND
jgi:hypothetical protein